MKLKMMPTTIVLMVCSWLTAIAGLSIGVFYCLSSVKIGIGIIFLGIILSALIRTLGNMSETVFRINTNLLSTGKNTDQILSDLIQTLNENSQNTIQTLNGNFQNIAKTINDNFQSIVPILGDMQQNLQQINSDSRDINQNIHNIWLLFENIKNTLEK
jgi:methyl-accepting chemotaxis protein